MCVFYKKQRKYTSHFSEDVSERKRERKRESLKHYIKVQKSNSVCRHHITSAHRLVNKAGTLCKYTTWNMWNSSSRITTLSRKHLISEINYVFPLQSYVLEKLCNKQPFHSFSVHCLLFLKHCSSDKSESEHLQGGRMDRWIYPLFLLIVTFDILPPASLSSTSMINVSSSLTRLKRILD